MALHWAQVEPDDSFQDAEAQARALLADGARVLEMPVRLECADYLAELPEPPRILREGSHAQSAARARLERGRSLLGRLLALSAQDGPPGARERDLLMLEWAVRAALRLHGATAQAHSGAADVAWVQARQKATAALSPFRSWESPERTTPAYDAGTGASRYDPRPRAQVELKLDCPAPDCRRAGRYFPERDPEPQPLRCKQCGVRFHAWLVEADAAARALPGQQQFVGHTCDGAPVVVSLADDGAGLFAVAAGDLLAFLGRQPGHWELLENLATGGRFQPRSAGPCFLASAALGPDAPELATFRAFRDRALLPRPWGRRAVLLYYRWGPWAAEQVKRRPALRRAARSALAPLHRLLVRQGY